MGASEKRARKKLHRDAAEAARRAALRRRRTARLIGVAVVVGGIVAVALASGGGDSGDQAAAPSPSSEGCGDGNPPAASPGTYKGPDDVLQDGVDYSAVIHTSCGDIEMDLLEDSAPISVNNFIFLAREGFYDGLIWHRVEGDSVIQTGDPNGQNGQEPDGPGYAIDDEPPDEASEYVYGVVGMANAGPNTGGSQFFIVVHRGGPAGFPPDYSIFGEVALNDEGLNEALETIRKVPTKGGNDPVEAVKPIVPVYIESIDIVES